MYVDYSSLNLDHKKGEHKKNTSVASHLVPSVEFYDIPQHINILNRMSKDFSLGEHLLLVGPQVKKLFTVT